jgi:hypothetical protein
LRTQSPVSLREEKINSDKSSNTKINKIYNKNQLKSSNYTTNKHRKESDKTMLNKV